MTTPITDPRAVVEFRVPATALRAGDVVNTSPGGDDDWQEVLGVYLNESDAPGDKSDLRHLVAGLGGRYVVVQLTDIAPVDSNVYFSGGTAMAYATEDDGADHPVTDVVSTSDGVRTYLYTKFELVTVRK